MSLKLTYIGYKYFYFAAQNFNADEEDEDFGNHYKVRKDLAETWTEYTEYEEGKDFSIEVQNNQELLLVPYIDPNQLKLFNPETQ